MTNITIYTSGDISINGRSTGWTVLQEMDGTAVYRTVKRPAPVLGHTDNGWVKAEGFTHCLATPPLAADRAGATLSVTCWQRWPRTRKRTNDGTGMAARLVS